MSFGKSSAVAGIRAIRACVLSSGSARAARTGSSAGSVTGDRVDEGTLAGRYAGAYGAVDGRPSFNRVSKTPNVDRVACEGLLFRNAFSW
jgi:hypothetical protein